MRNLNNSLLFCSIVYVCYSITARSSTQKNPKIVKDPPKVILTPAPVIEEKIEPKVIEQMDTDEFNRSTANLKEEISIDTFKADKLAILKIIKELNTIMIQNNFNAWKKYLSRDSLVYWSNPKNLKEVSKKLPIKGFELTSLEDYFNLIFIPARIGREVTEIRYISEDNVKAVQVQGNRDIIYYSFVKINEKWLLNLEK